MRYRPYAGPTANSRAICAMRSRDARAVRDAMLNRAGPLVNDIKSLLLTRDGDQPPTKVNMEELV